MTAVANPKVSLRLSLGLGSGTMLQPLNSSMIAVATTATKVTPTPMMVPLSMGQLSEVVTDRSLTGGSGGAGWDEAMSTEARNWHTSSTIC